MVTVYIDRNSWQVGPNPDSRSKKITHRQITEQIYLGGSPDDIIAKMEEIKARDIAHPYIEVESDYEYGESYARVYLRYWRPMTQPELDQVAKAQRLDEANRRQAAEKSDQDALERIRKEHPEWLKEGV